MVKKLNVPIKLYDQALAFCNRRRKEIGKKKITKLPAGRPSDGFSCPCANAVAPGMKVELNEWEARDSDGIIIRSGEDSPSDFIDFFDDRANADVVLPIRGMKKK